MDDEFARLSNQIEAGFWMFIGLCFVVALLRPAMRRAKFLAAANFFVFGGSDLVEAHTGAWWRPWWLLVWKVACVAVMVAQWVMYARAMRAAKARRKAS